MQPPAQLDMSAAADQRRTIDGLLLTVSADALVMEAASGRVTLSVAQVDRVRVRRRVSLKNGILEGLAAGAAGAALAALLTDGHDRRSTPCTFFCGGVFSTGQVIAAAMLVGGVLGIGAGAAIDAVIKERRLVYEKASGAPQARLVIGPLVRRGGCPWWPLSIPDRGHADGRADGERG
jgi:hypothetical protein